MATTLRAVGGHTGTPTRRVRSGSQSSMHRDRGRVVLEVVALVVIAILLVLAPVISRSHAPEFDTSTVLTEPGDTLWMIAAENPVPGLSTSETVQVLAEINSLSGAVLPAGMTVQVPAEARGIELALR